MTKVYGVFEGGGVKGLALVGALARVQEEKTLEFAGYAGTSAGSIVASMAAVGYRAHDPKLHSGDRYDMKGIMDSLNYIEFLDNHDQMPLHTIRSNLTNLAELSESVQELFQDLTSLYNASIPKILWHAPSLYKKHKAKLTTLMDFKAVADRLLTTKGIYGTTNFEKWMRSVLNHKGPKDKHGNVTFGTIKKKSNVFLKVVATDLQTRRPRLYDHYQFAGISVASAAKASMSIPLFFCPYSEGGSYLVDGGMLSNFPAWAFDQEKMTNKSDHHVIGFRLVPEEATETTITSFKNYATELFHTALDGTDELQTRQVNKLILINIRTPPGIWATKFDLSPEDRDHLFKAGYQAADEAFLEKEIRNQLSLPPFSV